MQQTPTLFVTDADGTVVEVVVTRKRVKNLNLRVSRTGTVSLSIPMRTSLARAQEFLDRRSAWILEHVRQAQARHAAGAQPVHGGVIDRAGRLPLWGAAVPLADALAGARMQTWTPRQRAFSAPAAEGFLSSAARQTGAAPASTPAQAELSSMTDELKSEVTGLYRREVALALPDLVSRLEPLVGVHASRWSVRSMRTRWGSCTPKTGAIRIALELAAYPPDCLEMVVAHELVHLREPSHNARFHALLDTYCPQNRKITGLLKRPAMEIAQGRAPERI